VNSSFRTETPRISENTSENTFVSPQQTLHAAPATFISPEPIFCRPASLSPGPTISDSDVLTLSPYNSQAPTPIRPSSPPPKPLHPDRVEMIYIRYTTEKESWLAQNPSVRPAQYRKARGLPKYSKRAIESNRRHLPLERRKPSGEFISKHPNWTQE